MTVRRRGLAVLLGLTAAVVMPALALAHPLGNFTVNHYAGLRITPEAVHLDVVLDRAEIPTFQIRRTLDGDGDGELSPAELDTVRASGCAELASGLSLTAGGTSLDLRLVAAGVTFPPGNGGLSTMRLVCEFEAPFASPLAGRTAIAFRDTFLAERIGWREIVVQGDGTSVEGDLPAATTSARLTSYPTDLLATPLDVREATVTVVPGGPVLAPAPITDAQPLAGAGPGVSPAASSAPSPGAPASAAPSAAPVATAAPAPSAAAIPGGVEGIPAILTNGQVEPLLGLVALLTAAALGAGHALTPGHGKTLMAAYLVGTRGTPAHAAGLGLSVSVSHTLGILALALVVVGAQQALPPDVVVRAAPVIAAVTIVLIGGWMLITELRRWRERRSLALAFGVAHDHGPAHGGPAHDHGPAHAIAQADGHDHQHAPGVAQAHEHGHELAHASAHGQDHSHRHAEAHHHDPHELDHGHAQAHLHEHASALAHSHAAAHRDDHEHVPVAAAHPTADDDLEHSHGGIRHRHVPAPGASISWRSLFILGLAGGLVPSTNALLILLATIAAGRPVWGIVLVVAFGLGMAAVMGGVGLLFVYARGFLERLPSRGSAGRLLRLMPLGAAVVVLGIGLVLTGQAIGVRPVL